ncbi:MAG TPA: WecB/TagA/CpsF family glycosyltransferase [Actinomycetota bacterium]|nr:WecB/TagA/CpsF family glycosyltransferase [Actinomycetota bacterium]
MGRFKVLGVGIDPVTMDDALARLDDMVRTRAKGYLVFCTVSSLVSAADDPAVARAIEDATVVTPDGMPLVWLGKRRATRPVERVYGPDFLREVLARRPGLRHFFYGGGPGVAEKMARDLAATYPGLEVAGAHSPPYGLAAGEVDTAAIDLLNSAGADVVWVGLGHPKQEMWMQVMQPHLDAPVLAGVGAAFDFLSGAKREAPEWMKRSGLQWLHRLLSEPRRLAKRYVVGNTRFLWLLVKSRRSDLA